MDVIYYILFLLLFLIICSIFFKGIEGFDDKFYYDKLIDYKTIPNSYVNDSTPSRTINKFGFYKGEGTFKKGYSAETKSDEKISTLNKLLNKLLGRIVSDNNDCVGEFGKYSECDKSCGSNSYQTRTYNVSQERGQNGLDCAFEDGYKEKKRCAVDECQLGDICENNADCGTGNCGVNSTRCENMVPCDTNNVHVCDEDECIKLNDNDAGNNDNDNVKMLDGVYIYNNVDEECFFKTPAEIEELNLSIYTYDYRTISEQVQNLVLDCKYYQVKKDGGPCINGSNITVGDDGAKCKLGFGPQPTMFNGSYACTKCLIINDDETDKNPDACWCGTGKIPELKGSTYTCEPYTAPPGNVCLDDADELHFVKFRPPGTAAAVVGEDECQHCPADMAYKREGDNITCIKCAGVSRTLSSFCIEPSVGCPNTAVIKGNIAVDDGAEQELCVIDTSPEEPITRCEEGTDCSNSSLCNEGWSHDADEKCVRCFSASEHCDLNSNVCFENGPHLKCLKPEAGYYIDTATGTLVECDTNDTCAAHGLVSKPGECLAESGTDVLQKCTAPPEGVKNCDNTNSFFYNEQDGSFTTCYEYGGFFTNQPASCDGACVFNGLTSPGHYLELWKWKPKYEGDAEHLHAGGCPMTGEYKREGCDDTDIIATACYPDGGSPTFNAQHAEDYPQCGPCGSYTSVSENVQYWRVKIPPGWASSYASGLELDRLHASLVAGTCLGGYLKPAGDASTYRQELKDIDMGSTYLLEAWRGPGSSFSA